MPLKAYKRMTRMIMKIRFENLLNRKKQQIDFKLLVIQSKFRFFGKDANHILIFQNLDIIIPYFSFQISLNDMGLPQSFEVGGSIGVVGG